MSSGPEHEVFCVYKSQTGDAEDIGRTAIIEVPVESKVTLLMKHLIVRMLQGLFSERDRVSPVYADLIEDASGSAVESVESLKVLVAAT